MKKQSSLLNFFQKASPSVTSAAPTQASQRSDHIRKADEVGSEKNKSTIESEKNSQDTTRNSAIITPEKAQETTPTPDKTFNRLKKVKIASDDEDVTFNPSKIESESVHKPEEPRYSTRSASPISALEAFKSKAKSPAAQKFIDDESDDSEKNKKSATKSTKKSNNTTPAKEIFDSAKKPASKGKAGGSAKPNKETRDDDMIVDLEKEENKVIGYNDFSDYTPEWAQKDKCKDKKGRSPDDENYDPTTLYIPPKVLEKLTPTMRQYWTIKSDNFDKILLFKLGKFYELFYDDALICHKELDLAWMGDKMHVGFPEKAIDRFGCELVKRGYKVCVVEQMETPKQMEERLRLAGSKKDKTIKRDLVQIMSKGTFVDQNDNNPEPRYLLSIRSRKELIGVTFLDISTGIISLGAFKDDPNYTIFKMLVSQIRPSEVVYEFIETDPNLVKIMKNSFNAPVFSPLNDPRHWNTILCNGELEKYYGPDQELWPIELRTSLKMKEDEKDIVLSCFAGMISYLTKMLIIENVLSIARYEKYDPYVFSTRRMVLDSQALQHLEILEVGYSSKNPYEGSLLHYMDKTMTPFGKRMLRKWVCGPLLSINSIYDRLDAIEELEQFSEARKTIRLDLKKLPDLERLCGRVYSQSVRKANTANLFEEIGVARLREFKKLMEAINEGVKILKSLEEQNPSSKILQSISTFDNHDEIMKGNSFNVPDISPLQKELNEFIQWTGDKKDIPVPRPGVDNDYDSIKEEIAAIEDELTKYLKTIQQRFNNHKGICFAHTKHRYEIEVPTELVSGNKKPKDFEFSSKKGDRERFITKDIKDFVERLEEAEDKLKNALNIFTCFFFSYFHKYYKVWDRLTEALATLDCLCSLSITSFLSDGVMCRPTLYPMNERVFLDVKNMRHPCVAQSKSTFVSNDILIGDVDETGKNRNVILLTGPNMGGKSTILRQACIAAIMAQIGCYVPAEQCQLSIVDRIFTRIGASDKLLEGKSTFYIEMEETLNILKYGSINSLAIVDELGRGTSTFDGVSIAYAVLNHILHEMKCRTLFATHYHVLLDEFRDSHDVSYYHMASRIDHTGNSNGRVIFLYKLTPGECSNSFGLNIARLTGLPTEAMEVAKEKADEFEKNLNIREYTRTNKAFSKAMGLLNEVESISKGQLEEAVNSLEEALKLMNVA